jgi:hypothetical protein
VRAMVASLLWVLSFRSDAGNALRVQSLTNAATVVCASLTGSPASSRGRARPAVLRPHGEAGRKLRAAAAVHLHRDQVDGANPSPSEARR